MQTEVLTRGPRRTKTVSFRIDPTIASALEVESRTSGVTLNALASQIFRRHVAWGRYAEKLKLIPVSKDLLRELFQTIDKETLIQTARKLAETSGREHILFLFQRANLNTVIRFLDIWRNHFDASEHRVEGKTHLYTVRHEVNLTFSLFLKEYVSALIQNTVSRPVHFETVSPNSATFAFDES